MTGFLSVCGVILIFLAFDAGTEFPSGTRPWAIVAGLVLIVLAVANHIHERSKDPL